jgi:IS30 family transposase
MPRGHYLTEAVKDAIWVPRAEGVSEAEIDRRLGLPKRTVSKYLQRMGGIRPRARRRPECCLTVAEREEISRGIAQGESARAIGRARPFAHDDLARDQPLRRASELPYACGRAGGWCRARRLRATKLELCPVLRELVIERLGQDHSPQQISGWLRLSYPDNDEMQVSHETIYRFRTSRRAGRCAASSPGISEPGVRSASPGHTPTVAWVATANADLPSLSYGHLDLGDSTGPAPRGTQVSRRTGVNVSTRASVS